MSEKKVVKKITKKRTKKAQPLKTLVIVESPAKAKTINRYLGKNYVVEASLGHLIDLPKSRMAIDVDNNFKPDYITVRGRGKILNLLKRRAAKAKEVLLAADEDREGEAISYHIRNELRKKYPDLKIRRIVFHEITKNAIREAIKEPTEVDESKVNAQKARRILDRLVGYNISPLLWERVKKGLSAGRVQSVALKIICEREREIKDFNPSEYWTMQIELAYKRSKIVAALQKIDGKKAEIHSQEEVDQIISDLKSATYSCSKMQTKERKRNPTAPFTTSKLQQASANKLKSNSSKTMRIAQQLYEGVDVSNGPVGLITYMRTDSVRISDGALEQLRTFVKKEYGEEYLPEKPLVYKNKKGSQNAHEAIRPTDVTRTPDAIKKYLTRDQFRLYKLIWEKFVSAQMTQAIFAQTTLEIEAGKYLFRASGSKSVFKGFLSVYGEIQKDEKTKKLPNVKVGTELEIAEEPEAEQHFTQPPPRFTDATIIKILEESGIGRPSTYAPTVTTLLSRYYIVRKARQLIPTELGELIDSILVKHFPDILNLSFTSNLEDKLDDVESGKVSWTDVLSEFYTSFKPVLEAADKNIENMKNIFDQATDLVCEKCEMPMVKRLGRYGYFLACSGFPECRNTKPIPLADCPVEGCDGHIVAKKGKKRGVTFYGCTNFSEEGESCAFVSWDKPVEKKCDKCGGLMVEKTTKELGYIYKCINKECGHVEKVEV